MARRFQYSVSAPQGQDPFGWARSNVMGPNLAKLRKQLIERWKRIAAERIPNPTMLAHFMAAMQITEADVDEGFRLEFRLKSQGKMPWGPAIELGWAPTGPSFRDGLGEYDGSLHDMRPFLLAGAEYRRIMITNSMNESKSAHAKESPLQYLVRKMQSAQVPNAMASKKAKYFRTADGEEAPTVGQVQHRQARVKNRLQILAKVSDLPRAGKAPLEGGRELGLPPTITESPATRRMGEGKNTQHRNSMLKNGGVMHAAKGNGNALITIRTVSAKVREGWMTRGIQPAATFDDLGAYTGELLREFFAVK